MSFNPDEHWKKFEEIIIADHTIEPENLIHDLLKFYEKNSDSQKTEEMKKEQKLLNVFFHNHQSHVWEWCLNNPNKPFPEWKIDDISYYEMRRANTANPIRKARYSYAIWTIERKNIEDAKSSIEFFVKAAEIYGEKTDLNVFQDDEMIRFLEISKKLGLLLNLPSPHDAKSVFQKTHSILQKQNSIAEHRIAVCSGLIKLLTKCGNELLNSKYAKDIDIQQILKDVITLVDGYAIEFNQKSSVAAEQNFLEKKLELAMIIKDEALVKSTKLYIAQLLEKRAEQAENNAIHSIWLQEAAKVYHELGMTEKVKEIAKICEADVQKAMENGEFNEIEIFSTEIKTIREFSNRYKKKLAGKKPADILLQITLDDNWFIPNWKKTLASTHEEHKKYPLSGLFKRIEFTDSLPSRQIDDDSKKITLDANKSFLIGSTTGITIFGELIKCLLDNKQVEKKHVVDFLKSSVNVEQDDMPLIEKAICYYIDGDHVAFSHVIMPRIEQMMRAIIKKLGGSTITYDSQELGFDQRLMGGLIRELQSLIDEDFYKHLDVWLGTDGQNMRNKISHGWLKNKDFNELLSDMLLYTILRLSMA